MLTMKEEITEEYAIDCIIDLLLYPSKKTKNVEIKNDNGEIVFILADNEIQYASAEFATKIIEKAISYEG